ncbi:MAG: asparagine synthase (glutamine-hydrolyzing) [Vicinamibacterales bacterium]
MCGIVGSVVFADHGTVDERVLERMTDAIRHRGPDDGGVWAEGCAGLGARRLAVIDLSARGHQPMANEDGSVRIAFNGEVYNFQSLREELEGKGHRFRSNTDTETVLHLYEEEGPDCVRRLRGMFAFAVWDGRRRTLLLARDRLGKKPLFYFLDDERLVFASEPKAILQDESVPARVSFDAIHHYLTFGVVPGPLSAFDGFHKVPPAHYLLLTDGRVSLHRYWSLHYQPKRTGPEAALAGELLARLGDAVSARMISDVPLGALLSGGIDSSVVVAMMRRRSSGQIRTFSIGFDDRDYNELPKAREVARHFETDHHELIVRPDAAALLPRLAWHHDEPFGDSSALPSFVVSELARQSVTVALTGDGGDESFLGYDRYLATSIAGRLDSLPRGARAVMARTAGLLPRAGQRSAGPRLARLASALPLAPRDRYFQWLTGGDEWKDDLYTPEFAEGMRHQSSMTLLSSAYDQSDAASFVEQTAHADVLRYLPDDLLVKMDIASMANSLEVRSPLLDHELVEFAASLPAEMKLRGTVSKYLVRKVMTGVLPESVLRQSKRGFGVPIDRWFRQELREMAYDLLLDEQARHRGYFRPEVVRRYLDEHVQGVREHQTRLWVLLMLELWHRTFIDRRCPATAPAAA